MENKYSLIGKKILIVEDEFIVTELLQKYFQELEELKDAEIFFANNVEQCIELLEKEKPTFMILDLSLNGAAENTGLKILNKYKGLLKIAVFSAYDDYMVQCLNEGAIEYVHKPANRDEYRRLILEHA